MPASEAQLAANRANALKSTGPKTPEGKDRSRANSYKHGLTGRGVVMPAEEAAEVDRLARTIQEEMKPPGEVGAMLVRRIAMLSVRMDQAFFQDTAARSRRVRRVIAEFEAPAGVSAEEAALLRDEAANEAIFDGSKEGVLAQRYEAAAERGFYRAIQELRLLQKASVSDSPVAEFASQAKASMAKLGSLFPVAKPAGQLPRATGSATAKSPSVPARAALSHLEPGSSTHFEVPITIGRPR